MPTKRLLSELTPRELDVVAGWWHLGSIVQVVCSLTFSAFAGIVRDLLCSRCNAALGLFRDDAEVLAAAVAYLLKHRADPSGILYHALEETA